MDFKEWSEWFDKENGCIVNIHLKEEFYKKTYSESLSIFNDTDLGDLLLSDFLQSFHTKNVFDSVIDEHKRGVSTL